MNKNPGSERVVDAIRGRGPLSHSALYWWLWDNFEDIQHQRRGRADWITATREFSDMGFTGRDKTPLRRENVRKTWVRVVRDKKLLPTPAKTQTEVAVRPPLPVQMIEPEPEPKTAAEDDPLADLRRQMNRRSGRRDDD